MNIPAACMRNAFPLLIVFCLFSSASLATSSVEITLDPKSPGAVISSDFIGLSYEMSLVDPATNGEYFFSPTNRPLIQLFRTLGIQSLRVGGNTAERDTVRIPDKADIDRLFGFARAAGVKVIYTLRLNGNTPADAARTAKYIVDNYRRELTCLALGNESDKIFKDSQAYNQAVSNYMAVISAPTNAPDARFCGPSTMHKDVQWANDFAREFARDKHVMMVTQHEYPGGSGRVATNAVAACEKLLSASLYSVYQKLYDAFVPTVLSSGMQYRLEEANSYSNGGASGSSDAFASALWGLDYLYWWASHDAAGINFHTGGYVGNARPSEPQRYVVFWNSPEGFAVRPLGYGIKAFDLGCHGQLIPAHVTSNTNQVNLSVYGVLSAKGDLYITVINKETDRTRDATVTIAPGGSYTRRQVMFLTAPRNDITATGGITLGDAPIKDDGSWAGTWTSLAAPFSDGLFSISVSAASAAIVQLTK
jgi:hypothetical protein